MPGHRGRAVAPHSLDDEMTPGYDARRALEDDRARTRARLAALSGDHTAIVEASSGSNGDDEHDPEGATIAFERSQVESLARQERNHLDEVEAALRRVDDGSYGICESCGRQIAPARLEARPVARTCIGCATREGRRPLSRG